MKPDNDLMRRILIDIANQPTIYEPFFVQYSDTDKVTVNWHLAYLIELKLLKGKVLGASSNPDTVAILGITQEGYAFIDGKQSNTSPGVSLNISHSTVTVGDKNKVQSKSNQISTATTPQAQQQAIKAILIGIVATVVGGLIVWYLTKMIGHS